MFVLLIERLCVEYFTALIKCKPTFFAATYFRVFVFKDIFICKNNVQPVWLFLQLLIFAHFFFSRKSIARENKLAYSIC